MATKWVLSNTEFGTELRIENLQRAAEPETELESLRRQNRELRLSNWKLKLQLARTEHNEQALRIEARHAEFTTCSACDTVWSDWKEMRKQGGHFCLQLQHVICRFCVFESSETKERARCHSCPKGKNGVQFPKSKEQLELEGCVEEDEDGEPDPSFALTHWTIDGKRIDESEMNE